MTYNVIAQYDPKMSERREKRIHAALNRCDVKWAAFAVTAVVEGDEDSRPFQITFSNVDWTSYEDGTETRLEIYIGDDVTRAARLASELRCCGMVANVVAE